MNSKLSLHPSIFISSLDRLRWLYQLLNWTDAFALVMSALIFHTFEVNETSTRSSVPMSSPTHTIWELETLMLQLMAFSRWVEPTRVERTPAGSTQPYVESHDTGSTSLEGDSKWSTFTLDNGLTEPMQ